MGSLPIPTPASGVFQPMFILPDELQQFGLPTSDYQPDILNLVQLSSTMIDQYCLRTDGDGLGSLVYTTYMQRLLFQAPGRNLSLVPMKPLVPVSVDVQASLAYSGQYCGAYCQGNVFDTGVIPNTVVSGLYGTLSAIVGCSGRYGYTRRDMSQTYPDLNALINPITLVSLFGGPPPWIAVDLSNTDYDPRTGEIWIPAGLQLQRYSEVILIYNSGYHPAQMPKPIKMACAALTKNMLAKGAGTTGMTGFSMGRSGVTMTTAPDAIDPNIQRLLDPYKAIRGY